MLPLEKIDLLVIAVKLVGISKVKSIILRRIQLQSFGLYSEIQ
jgi:hypothetical protein